MSAPERALNDQVRRNVARRRRRRRGGAVLIACVLVAAVVGAVVLGRTITAPSTSAVSTPACVGGQNQAGSNDPWGSCWPGPQNTGYPQGLPGDSRQPVELTPYTGATTIKECGVVIDSKIVNGDVVVEAGNGSRNPDTPCVTIKNSLVNGVIHTDDPAYGPVVVTDTEVAVPGLSWWENIGRYNVFVWRINSHGSEGVIKCADTCATYDSWVHGMRLGGAYHYNAFGGNGIETANGSFVIEHNWASCGDWVGVEPDVSGDAGCSAVIGFYGDFAPIRNITLNRNYLAGATIDPAISDAENRQPGYCLNPGYYPGKPYPSPSNVTVTDNIFGIGFSGKCGVFGPVNSLGAVGAEGGNVWSGNRFEDGTDIPRVEE